MGVDLKTASAPLLSRGRTSLTDLATLEFGEADGAPALGGTGHRVEHELEHGALAEGVRDDLEAPTLHDEEPMLRIEVKGQWHSELWSTAAGQLRPIDWRANGRGIYLVLWFGPGVGGGGNPKAPPDGVPKPTSALNSAMP